MKNLLPICIIIFLFQVFHNHGNCQYINKNYFFYNNTESFHENSNMSFELLDNPNNIKTIELENENESNKSSVLREESNSVNSGSSIVGDWQEIGPLQDYPTNNSIGRIIYIGFPDPTNKNKIFACAASGGLFYSIDGGNNWRNGGTDKGLYNKDGNPTLCGVSCAVSDPVDVDNVWYLATGEAHINYIFLQSSDGIHRTVDGGKTWQYIGLGENSSCDTKQINKIFVIAPGHILVASTTGLWECTNALDGTPLGNQSVTPTFIKRIDEKCFDIETIPNTNKFFITTRGDNCTSYDPNGNKFILYLYDNQTKEVKSYNNSEFDARYIRGTQNIEISNTEPGVAYILQTNGPNKNDDLGNTIVISKHKLFRVRYSFDPSESITIEYIGMFWSSGGGGIACDAFLLSQTNKDEAFFGTVGEHQRKHLVIATNLSNATPASINCTTRYSTNLHNDINCIVYSPDYSEMWYGTDGGVAKSLNEGVTSTSMNNGLGVATIYNMDVSQSEPLTVIHGNQDCGTRVMRQNADKTWTSIYQDDGDDYTCLIDPKNSDHFYSLDGKKRTYEHNWPSRGIWIFSTSNYKLNSTDANIVYFTKTDGLYKSTPSNRGGEIWSLFPEVTDQTPGVFGVSTNPAHSNFIYVGWAGGDKSKIFKSSTGGGADASNWTVINAPDYFTTKDIGTWQIMVDFYDPNHIWVGGSWRTIYSVNTLTGEWTAMPTPYDRWGYYTMEIDRESDCMYFNCYNDGVYYNESGDPNVVKFDGDLPYVKVNEIKINYKTMSLFAGTLGRGVWSTPVVYNPSATDISLTNITSNVFKHASNSITCSGTISASKRLFLRSDKRIDLKPGFTTSDKTIMNAYVLPYSTSGLKSASASSGAYSSDVGLAEEIAFDPIPSAASIYPNPTNGVINILLKSELKPTQIDVFDNYGKKLLSKTTLDETASFDLSGYAKGIYMVTVRNNDYIKTFKVMVR